MSRASNLAGFTTNIISVTPTNLNVGVITATNLNVGVITATSFIGNFTGNLTGTASSVSLNSVELGTHTYGNYVQSVSGTTNQITVTSGTGEGSTPTLSVPNQFTAPQDVTVTRDLQINRNLNVNGNITIGGSSATLFTTELKIYDPDIVLGIRTDANSNDISTDNTANHGGIAIASTEGTPLIQLYNVGIGETNPATYKKFMWFKSGTFTGLGTDAWISNYAIGIGSTQIPSEVRLAAGGMQVTDSTLSVPRFNVGTSGTIITTTSSGLVGIGTTNPTSTLQIVGGDTRFNGVTETVSTATTYLSGTAMVLEMDVRQATTYTYTVPTGANIGIVSFKNVPAQTNRSSGSTITLITTQNSAGTANTTAATGIGTNCYIVGYENGAAVAGISTRALVGSATTVTLSTTANDRDFVSFFIHYTGNTNTTASSYQVYVTKNGNFRQGTIGV